VRSADELSQTLAVSRGVGYPIFYYQDGAGPCNASAVAAPAPAPAPVIEPHVRSFGAWMRSLDSNPVLIVAWIVTIPSGEQQCHCRCPARHDCLTTWL
jgi:hypothetical protein